MNSINRIDVVTLGESMVVLSPLLGESLHAATIFRRGMGGAEGNVSVGLARLGHQVRWISRVGDDGFGRFIINALRGEGVDVSVVVDPSHPTGVYFKEPLPGGRTRVTYYRAGSAAAHLSPEDVEAGVRPARYLLITGITPALSSTCRASVETIVGWAHGQGTCIVFDPNIRHKLWPSVDEAIDVLRHFAERAHVIVPSLEEGALITGRADAPAIADWFLQRGQTETVVLKLGREGAYYQSAKESGILAGYPVRQVDEVGAGDAFVAGMLSGFLEQLSLKAAVNRGCAMGAMAVTSFGDYEALPTRSDLNLFLQEMSGIHTSGER